MIKHFRENDIYKQAWLNYYMNNRYQKLKFKEKRGNHW